MREILAKIGWLALTCYCLQPELLVVSGPVPICKIETFLCKAVMNKSICSLCLAQDGQRKQQKEKVMLTEAIIEKS